MKIAFFQIEPWQKKIIEDRLSNYEFIAFNEPLSQRNIEKAKDTEILMLRATALDLKLNRETLTQFPNLKLISTMSTGFDHIDIEECKRRGIKVSNVPSYGEDTVAEYTFALLLAITRKIIHAIDREKDFSPLEIEGIDIKGKTIGIIGSGKIGLKAISLAKAFGMNVIAYDIYQNNDAAKILGFEYVSLEHLLKNSDIISLHAPLTAQTHHIINEKNIKLIKKGVIIINTARGGLIEPRALLKALDEEIISSAGLDVIDGELENVPFDKQPIEVQELIRHSKVLTTPHNAWNSREAKLRMMNTTVDNIIFFIKGRPQNIIA